MNTTTLFPPVGFGKVRELWRNWSNNHSFSPRLVHRPESLRELEFVVSLHADLKIPIRILGAGLSPNGLAFGSDVSLSLERMNRILTVDKESGLAEFECGITVEEVMEGLIPYGLMLPNLASINSQQLGGFYSVGAHGTGLTLPPVEEQIEKLTVVTPALGTLHLTRSDPLFDFCKLGLGLLGILSSVTVRCVPIFHMKQSILVKRACELSQDDVVRLAKENYHAKLLWIPLENKVVVFTANPVVDDALESTASTLPMEAALMGMQELFQERFPQKELGRDTNLADLRALVLQGRSLDVDFVKRVNRAEAEYYEALQEHVVVDRADKFMAFECGGAQLVFEICVKFGHEHGFLQKLMKRIEEKKFPVPCPIEHRFSSSSRAKLSPALGDANEFFSWIGVVMYLPNGDNNEEEIRKAFAELCELVKTVAQEEEVDFRVHWAKLEIGQQTKSQLQALYPMDEFEKVQRQLDPDFILGTKSTEWGKAYF